MLTQEDGDYLLKIAKEAIETFVKTNRKISIKYIYDGTGKVLQVYLNDKLYTLYEYNSFGKIQECIVLNLSEDLQKTGIATIFSFNKYGDVMVSTGMWNENKRAVVVIHVKSTR